MASLARFSTQASLVALTLISATPGCRHRIRLAIVPVEMGQGQPRYFVGVPDDRRSWEKVVLYVAGTGREPASRHFGLAAEATLKGFVVAYPEKMFLADAAAFHRADSRGQRLSELVAVVDDLDRRGMRKLLVVAASEGTQVAHEIAARYPARTVGVICLAGSVTPFREDLLWAASHRPGPRIPYTREQLEQALALVDAEPTSVDRDFWGHTYRFWSSQLDYDPRVHLASARWPVLFVNGALDEVDLDRQQRELQQLRAGGIDVESTVYPGVGHDLAVVGPTLAQTLVGWAEKKGL
ncbi:MAG: alpha/beta hydrolase [Deltaproteobacteria bacterium]|nr:alpha/beta hydrolase [Deltaproteobacteria bacterium]